MGIVGQLLIALIIVAIVLAGLEKEQVVKRDACLRIGEGLRYDSKKKDKILYILMTCVTRLEVQKVSVKEKYQET